MKAPPGPGPAPPFETPDFVEVRLSNGLTVRAARWGKRPVAQMALLFPGAGSAADPAGLEGTAEITAESFLGGTAGRSARELAEAIDDLAAGLDVSAGIDSAVARLTLLEDDVEAGLRLLREVLTAPSFPVDEVEKSRRRQIDLLEEQRSEPDFLARERLLDRLYPGHPYGRLAASATGLASLTRDDVVRFYRARFTFAGATLILVGTSAPEILVERAAAVFGEVRLETDGTAPFLAPPPPAVAGFTLHLVHRPGSVQTNLLFARPAIRRSDPLHTTAVVANQSLGGGPSSRLFSVLREERGLTYGAYSSLTPRRVGGHFGASIDCRTEVTGEALSGLLGLIRDYAREGPAIEEHDRARRYLSGSYTLGRETPGMIVQDEVTRCLHGLADDEWSAWRDRVAAVTRAQAADVAANLFTPSVGILAAVGDAARIRSILESHGETTLWDSDGPRP